MSDESLDPNMADYQPKKSTQAIDPDKVAEHPSLLPYAHHVGSAIIRPLDKGKVKGLAMAAMYEQTGTQLEQIRAQVELLISQAQDIHDRISISESIYQAEVNFKPNIGQTYYLYEREGGKRLLSLLGPTDWGSKLPYIYIASAKLLSDHTWDVVEMAKDIDLDADHD